MRIFLSTPFENRLAKRGTRFIDIANKLYGSGFDVVYVTSDFSHAYKTKFLDVDKQKDIEKGPYRIIYIPIPGYSKNISIRRVYSNFVMSWRFYKALRMEVKDNDIIMIPSRPVDYIYFISRLKRRKRNIKLILDIRDIWPDSFKKRSVLFSFYCNFFLKKSIKEFDKFIHISPNFVNWLRRYNTNAESVFIPPGFNSNRWHSCQPQKLMNCEKIRVVFVGALQYQLDILPFVKAISSLNNFELGILGEDGKGQRYKEVCEYINVNSIKNVHFLGVIEPNEVPNVLKEYDVGLIPMISDSITNKMFDYIAAYLPIFVLGENDMANMVVEYDIGWVSSFEINEIETLLKNIDKESISTKVVNIIKHREYFNRDNLYCKIEEVVIEAIGESSDLL